MQGIVDNMLPKPIYSIPEAQQTGLLETLPQSQLTLAQTIKDPDVLGQMRDAFQNFVESGQLWALVLGFMLGYWFSGLRRG